MRNAALVALCFALFSILAHARTLDSRVVSIDAGENETWALVFAEAEGRVLRVDSRQSDLIEAISAAAQSGTELRFDIGERGIVHGVMQLAQLKSLPEEISPLTSNSDFVPTVFASLSEAQTAFNSMSRMYKNKSQCFNRAHVWSYELWKHHSVSTGKVFIFFTRQYIRKFDFEWWFHVAPYTWVNEAGATTEYVLDRRYSAGPRDMRTWTNIFMKNDAFCPEVQKYSQYRQNQGAQWCYLIKANMFYRSPLDLELLERNGRQELGWNNAEIRTARREAFKNWRNFNP